MPTLVPAHETDFADLVILGALRDYFVANPPVLRLYVGDPAAGDLSYADKFTEAAWTGYAGVPLSAWSDPTLDSSLAKMESAEAEFTNTSGATQSYKGWYLTDAVDPTRVLAYVYDAGGGTSTLANGQTVPMSIEWVQGDASDF